MKHISVLLFVTFLLSSCVQFNKRGDQLRHYVVVDARIYNIEKYDKFIQLEIPILKKFDAYIAMDIRSPDQKRRYLVMSFPSRETVKRFVKSKDFQKILPLNKQSAKSTIFHGKLFY